MPLAPCTVITGASRVGKTSVLDTIRLALTGKHPVGSSPSDLMELAPDGAEQVFAELIGPMGSVSWRMDIVEGKPKRSRGVACQGAFSDLSDEQLASILVLDHGQVDGFGAERMRRAVMERFGEVDAVKAPPGLDARQTKVWDEVEARCTEDDPARKLVSMQKAFKAGAAERGAAAKVKQEAIAQLRAHTANVGGEDILHLLEEQLVRAEALEQAQAAYDRQKQKLDALKNQPRAPAPEVSVEALQEALRESRQELTRASTVVSLLERAQSDECPCCGSVAADVSDVLEKTRAREAAEQARVADLQTQLNSAEHQQRQYEAYLEVERQVEALESELSGGRPEGRGLTAADLRDKVRQVRDAQGSHSRLQFEESALQTLLDAQAVYKLLEQRCSVMFNDYLRQVATSAAATVNKYMPPGFETELRVTDKVCQWRMVGRDRRSHKTGAYSGSEGGTLAVARALAWAESAPYRLVMQDDVDLGVHPPNQLASVLNTLSQSVQDGLIDQVVIVWNRPHEVPGNWHIVNLGV